MNSKRNELVDEIRFICAIFVIAIHTKLGFENKITWIFFQTIARMAVPYFLVVTGWFFYKNFKENHKVIFQYISNLLKAYFVASLPFAVIYIVKNHTSDTFVTNFFASILWKGCSPHLWYFPATILALTICALLGIAMEKHSGGWLISIGWISNLMCSICDIYLHIFDFEMGGGYTAIFRPVCYASSYVLIGCGMSKKSEWKQMTFSNIIVIGAVIMLFVEEYVTSLMEINMTLTMAVMYVPVMIVLCSNILNQKYYCKTSCKKMNLKKASEFIYFYHPVLISIIGKFIYASFALFGMVSILMIFINWLLQRCDSKV